ncbi:MAG: hypothetical protein JWP91_3041 [Fibrobacteres bacterium]|nr:hypothetical protein [Fibrobacterota bacterium]
MSGEDEAVLDRPADAAVVEAPAVTGGDHTVVLHEEPPTYALSVEYGDFDALFQDGATVAGRQERMQAIGFYYGAVDGDEGPITRRCARHLREETNHAAGHDLTDEEFAEEFQRRLRCVVRKADGSLEPETDFTAEARLVFPGSFTFRENTQLGDPQTRHRYNAEQRMWDGNRGLSRIPVVAQVRNPAGEPVQGVKVCFEFIPPFDPPEGQKDYLSHISGTSEKTRSPRQYVRRKLPHEAHPPFGFNCLENKGGKIPADVLGHLIAQGAVPGFPYEAGTEGRPNAFSVTLDSDAEGKAGVVLLPSRMGGDCYKLKVHVITDGREPLPAETITGGLLTVWRNLRLCRIVTKPPQAGFAGNPPIAARMTGALGHISIHAMRKEYAKAFHILEADHRAASPLTMTEHSYLEAIRYAKRGVANPLNWNLDVLIKEDFHSPFLVWLETDTAYNANRGAGAALDLTVAATWNTVNALITAVLDRFLQYWNGGALPGLTVIRSEVGDSYSYWNHPNRPTYAGGSSWRATTSGVAVRYRGCLVYYPDAIYNTTMPYNLTTNTMHEMGHTLFLRHQNTSGALGSEAGGFPANHDSEDWCLMGYLRLTTADYCGKCLLKLRGWNEAAI